MAGAADLGGLCRKQEGLWLPADSYGIEATGAVLEPQAGSAPDEGKPGCGGALPPDEMEAALQNGGGSR